jgi:hypothetical protein
MTEALVKQDDAAAMLEAAREGRLTVPSVFAALREGRLDEDKAKSILRELEAGRQISIVRLIRSLRAGLPVSL